jgi:hypothetical protein
MPNTIPNQGEAPVDLTSNVGKVRLLLGDTDPIDVSGGFGTYLYFSDSEIEALLGMYGDRPKMAAARALETIAGSQALLLKNWATEDLKVSGDAIANALRNLAKQLREEAQSEESADYFNIVPSAWSENFGRAGW